ncbi:hypothetical protein [Clavibacter zhangzhiyongii]|uniref:hypothetical protein n=1 Tax=Clavibacter zhangzhiyongii TaxID=2768071 RepID=UPI0039E0E0E3
MRRGLDRLGIRTDDGRDAAAAVGWTLMTVLLLGVLATLVWADGTVRTMSPAQGAVIAVLALLQCAPLAASAPAPADDAPGGVRRSRPP